jgi:hypothetical protein
MLYQDITPHDCCAVRSCVAFHLHPSLQLCYAIAVHTICLSAERQPRVPWSMMGANLHRGDAPFAMMRMKVAGLHCTVYQYMNMHCRLKI